jgi:arginyl-tRNA synthetase
MYTLDKLKKEIAEIVNQSLGSDIVQASDLAYPPNHTMGDLSLPCFVIAKQNGKNPAEVAESLVASLGEKLSSTKSKIATISTAGPYLNFKFKKENLVFEVLGEIKKQHEKYGHNNSGERQKTMIEYSNVNTHKEYHVGHLRNVCFGDSVHRIMLANDYESIPVSYINDFGIHVAKTLWAYLEYYKDTELPENKGQFLGEVYVRSNKESKDKPHIKELINFMMKKIESRKGTEYELWKKTREWSIAQFDTIYKELDINFEKIYYESEFVDEGRDLVDELLAKKILKYSEGAVIADLEEQDLGVLVFLRSDGTATYPVADLALAKRKFDEFGLDASLYVVDVRQVLHFKQLFFVLKQMGYRQAMIHLGHDFVKLPDGMMSSRSGNTITYNDLKKLLTDKIREETINKHQDWDRERVEKVVRTLTRAVIKFEMLKTGAQQTITFDIEQALSFQGFTAAYLLYSSARISSIVKKSELSEKKILKTENIILDEDQEHELIIKLAKYPDIVKQSAKNFDPSVIAKYIFELAQDFNDYYHSVVILKAEKEKISSKLLLILGIQQVLTNGLLLLGIETIEEM